MTFRKWIRNIGFTVLAAAGIAAGCVFYAFRIEPYRITVNEYTLDRRPEGLNLKIAQISDLHIKEDFTAENLEKIIDRLNSEEPDLVIFTGDLYDNYAKMNENQSLKEALLRIKTKYGKIAIWGNRDYGGGAVRKYGELMKDAGFTLLKNENLTVPVGEEKSILITGLDDALLGGPQLPERPEAPEADLQILLVHEPDVAGDYSENGYDLILSGHSHGGQVRLPFIKVVTTALGEKYTGGTYQIGGENGVPLYVNTGIGTTHISARFGVVPEIALFHVTI